MSGAIDPALSGHCGGKSPWFTIAHVGTATAGVQIQPARRIDAEEIASVLAHAFAEFKPLYSPSGFSATVAGPSAVLVRMHEGPVWVAVSDHHIVGTAAAVKRATGVYVRGMAVIPAARGLGIGRLLLQEAELFAIDCGSRRLFLSTTPFLSRAIQLYSFFGFRPTVDGPADLFGTPLFTMEKLLGHEI